MSASRASLPHRVLDELNEAAQQQPSMPAAYTAALKFLHDIDDEDLLNDQLMIGGVEDQEISLEWPNYRLYFTIYDNLTCLVYNAMHYSGVLTVDAAIRLVVAHLRVSVLKDDVYDEYRKSAR
jgi:hypothetical protein